MELKIPKFLILICFNRLLLFFLSLFSRSYASSPVALQQKDCKIGWSRKMSILKWDCVYTFSSTLFRAPLHRLPRRFLSNIGCCSNVKQIDFISEPIYLERVKMEKKKSVLSFLYVYISNNR